MVNKNRCVVIGGGVISDYSKTILMSRILSFVQIKVICTAKR